MKTVVGSSEGERGRHDRTGSVIRGRRPPIEERLKERKLFFWTATETLKLVVLIALAVYLIVSLAEGRLPGSELVRYF